MIVRIATEGQYQLPDRYEVELNQLDNQLVELVEAGDSDGFRKGFQRLLAAVRERGVRLGDEHLAASDLILPPPDTTLAEAMAEFTGEGLLPD